MDKRAAFHQINRSSASQAQSVAVAYDSYINKRNGVANMKNANMTKEQIKTNVEMGKFFVIYNHISGDVVSTHKSHDSAMRKAAKIGYRYSVGDFRHGYEY